MKSQDEGVLAFCMGILASKKLITQKYTFWKSAARCKTMSILIQFP